MIGKVAICFVISLAFFSGSAWGQMPPMSPDCWRCVIRFCAEEARQVSCPSKRCEEYWMVDPQDPDKMIRVYSCSHFRVEHYAEVVEGQAFYNFCSQGGVGFVMRDRRQREVVCSFLYRCICESPDDSHIGGKFCAQGPMIGPEEVRLHNDFNFVGSRVCVYVEANPNQATATSGK